MGNSHTLKAEAGNRFEFKLHVVNGIRAELFVRA